MSHVPEYDHEAFLKERRETATHYFLGTRPDTELVEYPSGVLRGKKDGKVNYLLVRDGPMMSRWASLLTKGGAERGDRNWMRADTAEDLERFKQSACRHFEQWLDGDTDEDHAAAVFFNVNGVEHTKLVLSGAPD